MRLGRFARRRLAAAIVLAAIAVATAALVGGSSGGARPRLGGSRFDAGTGAATRRNSLVDALAPLLPVAGVGGARARSSPTNTTISLAGAVGQLLLVGVQGTVPGPQLLSGLRLHDWGGVVLGRANYVSPAQIQALTAAIGAAARAGRHLAPLIVARQGGGDSSAFAGLAPASQPQLGAIGRPDLANGQSQLAARQLRALGVNATLAPNADLGYVAGPAHGRAYGDSPGLVTRLTHAAIEGYRVGGLVSIAGHFPGQGGASQDPTSGPATVGLTLADLQARDLAPFRAAVRDAPMIQMSSAEYVAFDGVTPATLLPDAVALLRNRLGYRGVIVSGDLAAAAAAAGGGVGAAAVAALAAGVDLLYVPGSAADAQAAFAAVLTAVRHGQLDPIAIARSAGRVLAVKRAYRIA